MQEVHPINGGVGGRLFGDRRVKQQGHHPNNQQALRCPRCDSSNTKFCYYNNYNLSQPRHFCKNCRRYWTKGGVLRNVPVGGGCRKSKRSSRPKVVKQTTGSPSPEGGRGSLLQSHSSSESSNNNNSTTITTTTHTTASATTTTTTTTNMGSSGGSGMFQITDADILSIRNLDPLLDDSNKVGSGGDGCSNGFFHNELGGLMSLLDTNNNNNNTNNTNNNITSSSTGYNGTEDDRSGGTVSYGQFMQSQGAIEWDLGKISGTQHQEEQGMDDLLHNRGFAALDWHHSVENGHQGLFDLLPSAVDHHQVEYWNHTSANNTQQHSHWSDNTNDHPLFLP